MPTVPPGRLPRITSERLDHFSYVADLPRDHAGVGGEDPVSFSCSGWATPAAAKVCDVDGRLRVNLGRHVLGGRLRPHGGWPGSRDRPIALATEDSTGRPARRPAQR